MLDFELIEEMLEDQKGGDRFTSELIIYELESIV